MRILIFILLLMIIVSIACLIHETPKYSRIYSSNETQDMKQDVPQVMMGYQGGLSVGGVLPLSPSFPYK